MAAPHGESDTTPMLGRNITFQRNTASVPRYEPGTSFISKIVGSKAAPVNRVSESLDYEPIQNKLFYDRMKSRKEGKKKLYGWVAHHQRLWCEVAALADRWPVVSLQLHRPHARENACHSADGHYHWLLRRGPVKVRGAHY